MANFTEDGELLSELNDDKVKLMIPVIVYVSVLMFIGSLGNVLVCVYYGCMTKTSTNSVFIVTLAVFDLASSAITMPIEIVDLRFYYMFTNIPVCKISRLINHLAANGSASTLIAIAADRYRRLCCPLKPQLEIRHAKIAIILAVSLAVILSWPALIFYQPVSVKVVDPENESIILQGSDCTTTKDDSYKSYLWAFNIVQFVIYIVATTTLIVLYSLVGRAVYKYRGRRLKYASTKRIVYNSKDGASKDSTTESRRESKSNAVSTLDNGTTQASIQTIASTVENGLPDEAYSSSHEILKNNSGDKSRNFSKRIFSASHKASKNKNPKEKSPDVRTIKCTILMFVITLFFILGYLPYLVLVIWRIFQSGYEGDILSDAGLVGFNIGIRSYLINSAVNPILYGFFNDNFRRFFLRLFCHYCVKERRTLHSSASITSH